MDDRRRARRSAYSATAIAYVGNERCTCRVANVSADGLLVIPPIRARVGSFLRINLSLPALDTVIDVDGIVVRETSVEGYYAWGIELHQPTAENRALLQSYVEWARGRGIDDRARPRHPPAPTGRGNRAVELEMTGPALPRIGTSTLQRVGSATHPRVGGGTLTRVSGTGSGRNSTSVENRTGPQPRVTTSKGHPAVRGDSRSKTGSHAATQPGKGDDATKKQPAVRNADADMDNLGGVADLKGLYRQALSSVGPGKEKKDDKKKKKGWFR